MKPTERFSIRVENYVKYRPGYPREIIAFLGENCGLTADSVIADVGAGTGLSARLFLENGNEVFGIEPNDGMRAAGEEYLKDFSSFHAVKGTAEQTGLGDGSVDMVVSAQAFHWFDREKAQPEFKRILKPDGWVVLIWNQRRTDTPFLAAYEQFLFDYANDDKYVRHEDVGTDALELSLGRKLGRVAFDNLQEFDFEGLAGRVLSSSYIPTESDARYPQMMEDLRSLFAKYAENDKIKVFYDTQVYYIQL